MALTASRHDNGSMRSRPATASSFRSSPSPFPNQQNARQVLKRSGSALPTRTRSARSVEPGKLAQRRFFCERSLKRVDAKCFLVY